MCSIKNRFNLLRVVVSLAAIAVLSLAYGVTESQANDKLVLFVDVDEASFDTPHGTPGPFNIEGNIADSGDGTYQCWGWAFADGSGNVSQVYNIAGGSIMTQGHDGAFLAIVGGTGKFSEAKGQAFQDFTGDGFNFEITFFLDDDDDDDDDDD